jgi:ATP-dependent Clp protease adaptor protein ClpS
MSEVEISIDEKIKRQTKEPSKYKVVFLNDDKTPMDWVVHLLTDIFKHSNSVAQQITMTIHYEGSGVVGVYAHEIAEQKMSETVDASRERGFPLGVTLEPDE